MTGEFFGASPNPDNFKGKITRDVAVLLDGLDQCRLGEIIYPIIMTMDMSTLDMPFLRIISMTFHPLVLSRLSEGYQTKNSQF
jgi:hypothetical protein